MEKRNPIVILSISLRFAKEYLEMLCDINKTYTMEEIQDSDELLCKRRALWIALIIEIGCLFDTYEAKNKKVISFKKINIPIVKEKIDKIHGNSIIGRIIETRKTFTAHKGQEKINPISVEELCDSKLKILLGELDQPLIDFENWLKQDPKLENEYIYRKTLDTRNVKRNCHDYL
ncbi:MAG: hypothetical protein WCW25_01670 [Patescibacteria group bacterium]|jgi:hypothetical protein